VIRLIRSEDKGKRMRNGFRIIDTDTHVGPTADVLYEYASAELLARKSELAQYEVETRDGTGLSIRPYPYRRRMGEKPVDEGTGAAGGTASLKGNTASKVRSPAEPGVAVKNSAGRLSDMDREGRDIDLIIPGTFSTAISAIEPSLAVELHASYHRYMTDYCSADPDRLKGTLLAPAWNPTWAAEEIRRYADEKWVSAVTVVLPEGTPIDDPDLHPIWQAMDDANLPILHHSFFYEPPFFPGYRDVWGHVAIARAAAHPWGAQRLLGYLLLSGLFDQYQSLRIGFAECSVAWLPGWLSRIDGQADYLSPSLPVRKQTAMEYAQSDRVFCGIDLYEGETIGKAVMSVVGEGVMMYQSDYPHDQCYFPESPDDLLGWSIDDDTKRKLLSGNAEKFMRLL
jgi:predicted TIM-barrel fold metal-dependent hydrolase